MARLKLGLGAIMVMMILLQLIVIVEAYEFIWYKQNALLLKFFIRLIINLALLLLVCEIAFPKSKSKELFIPFYLINLVVFLMSYLFNQINLALSFALGLFTIYSSWRYFYRNGSFKYLVNLFIMISIGLATALSKVEALEIYLLNTFIIVMALLLNKSLLFSKLSTKPLQSDNFEMIKPENYHSLKEDLQLKTKLNIDKIIIEEVDFIKNSAVLKVYYI
jgi:hypothetical protein